MGRNAKFYKSQKDKKKRSSLQDRADDQVSKERETRSKPVTKRSHSIEEEASERDEKHGTLAIANVTMNSKTDKLKSKLWQDLEAKRAHEGKKKYATPKEAGIDYIRQWAKRGR